jgi:hypothetical protein
MANEEQTQTPTSVTDRFPALAQLEEDAERAKLQRALAEAQAATIKAKLPSTDVERAKLDQALAEAQAARAKALAPNLDVEIARDTVAQSEKTTGLARVLVQMDSPVLADDIAEVTLAAAREVGEPVNGRYHYAVRIVDDPSVLGGLDVYRLLASRLDDLEDQIDEYTGQESAALAIPLFAIATAVSVGLQAVGFATKLFARDYHVSGREVPVNDLGFDLVVAYNLLHGEAGKKPDEDISVEVDRLMPTPRPSRLLDRIWKLAQARRQMLWPAIASAGGALAQARANVKSAEERLTSLNAEILELTKNLPVGQEDGGTVVSERRELMDERREISGSLPELQARLADALAKYERGTALLTDLDEFITAAMIPAANGERPPALLAARVEEFADPQDDGRVRLLLYVRLIAGGVDQTIEAKAGDDHFRTLAGVSAEYALLSSNGDLLAADVRSVLQSTRVNISEPTDFEQQRPGYEAPGRRRIN